MPAPNQTPAHILRTAADYLERHGYHSPTDARDNYRSETQSTRPAASDIGAITWATYGRCIQRPEPEPSRRFRLYRQAINAYADHLEKFEGSGLCEPDTALDVILHLRLAADQWEAKQ